MTVLELLTMTVLELLTVTVLELLTMTVLELLAVTVSMLRMNLVWRLATRALIDMILAFFHTQEICGTLYLFLFFHPHTICLPLNVGCTGTTEALNGLLFY